MTRIHPAVCAALFILLCAAVEPAHAQLVGGLGGAGGGVGGQIIGFIIQYLVQPLLGVGVILVGIKLIAGHHSLEAALLMAAGGIVIVYWQQIAAFFNIGGA